MTSEQLPAQQPADKPLRRSGSRLAGKLRRQFCDELRHHGHVSRAAAKIGYARAYMYQLRDRDARLKLEWDEALEEFIDDAEHEAMRRAVIGTEEPVFSKGKVVAKVMRKSDRLLEFILERKRYPRQATRIFGGKVPALPGGRELSEEDLSKLSTEQLEALESIYAVIGATQPPSDPG